MNVFTGPLLAFLATGHYMLFWPVYRIFHPRKTQRRQALFRLFLLEVVIYVSLTGLVIVGVYRIPDFHHGGFLLAEIVYLVLAVIFWIATYGVWADNSLDDIKS